MSKHFLLITFIIAYLIFSFLTFKDYGITHDEEVMYKNGKSLFRYFFTGPSSEDLEILLNKKPPPQAHYLHNQLYGAILSVFNPKESYEIYHLLNLIFALPLFLASYFALYKFYKNTLIALLGPVFLFLTPRLIGDIPTNIKDVSFAVSYFLSLVSIFFLVNRKKIIFKILLLGILFGLSHSFRIIGFTLYLILFAYDFYIFVSDMNTRKRWGIWTYLRNEILMTVSIFFIATLIMTLSWPYISSNFPEHFFDILKASNSFPYETPILTLGKNVISTQLPWFYLPVWIFATMPLYLIFFFIASPIYLKNFFRHKLFLIFFSAFLVNVVFFILFKPVIYDAVRHYLFFQVIIVFLATISLAEFILNFKKQPIFYLLLILVGINLLFVIKNLFLLHPYQYTYFNEAVGGLKGAYLNFETDYWGASYKEAVEWLKKNKIKNDRVYYIYSCGNPISSTYYFSKNMQWSSDFSKVDFALCFTRWEQYLQFDQNKKIYAVERFGVPLTIIYALK